MNLNYFNNKNRNKDIFFNLAIFFIAFAYLSIWIWQGLDLTDTGYNLTKQWLVFNGDIKNQLGLTFGSTLIGGLWNQIIPGNNLIWARVGSVFIGSLSVLLVYLILGNYFDKKKVFIATLSVVPIAFVPLVQVMNYNDVPAFFMLLSIYLWVKSENIFKWHSFLVIIGAGICFLVAVFSRIPLITFLFFPLIIIINNLLLKDRKISFFKKYGFFIIGFLIGAVVIMLIMIKSGILKNYASAITNYFFEKSETGDQHSIANILLITLEYYYFALFFLPLIIFILNIFTYPLFIRNKIIRYIIVSFVLLFSAFFAYYFLNIYGFSNRIYYILFSLSLFFIIIFISKSKSIRHNFFIFLVLFYQIVLNLGSNAINWQNMYISLPLLLLLMDEISNFSFSDYFKKIIKFVRIKNIFIIFLIVLGLLSNILLVYRDSGDRRNLRYQTGLSNLNYIYTTKSRAEAVYEVVEEIEKNTNKYDKVLITNNVPLLYYLSSTIPVTRNPWAINVLSFNLFKEEIKVVFLKNEPKIIIIAKGSTQRDKDWPVNVGKIEVHPRIADKLAFLYQELKKTDYSLYWENEGFEIYKK